eukprot:6179513-Pleurochrysis_carterae.AAC.2
MGISVPLQRTIGRGLADVQFNAQPHARKNTQPYARAALEPHTTVVVKKATTERNPAKQTQVRAQAIAVQTFF